MFTRTKASEGQASGASLITDADFIGEIRTVVAGSETVFGFYYAELRHFGVPVHFWKVAATYPPTRTDPFPKQYEYQWYHRADLVSKNQSLDVMISSMSGPLANGLLGGVAFRAGLNVMVVEGQ